MAHLWDLEEVLFDLSVFFVDVNLPYPARVVMGELVTLVKVAKDRFVGL